MKKSRLIISNRVLYTFLSVLISILILGGIYAYTSAIPNPGHGANEIWVSAGGTEMTLQDAITQGKIVGSSCHSISPYLKSFASQGTYTWVKPAGVTKVKVDMAGAGGGSGGGDWAGRISGAGGGGAYVLGFITLPVEQKTYTIIIGAGGAGGTGANSYTAGGAGTASKFKEGSTDLIVLNPGAGGWPAISSYANPGPGGQGGTYTISSTLYLEGSISQGTQRTYLYVGTEYMASTPDTTGVYGGGAGVVSGNGIKGSDGYLTLEYSTITHC